MTSTAYKGPAAANTPRTDANCDEESLQIRLRHLETQNAELKLQEQALSGQINTQRIAIEKLNARSSELQAVIDTQKTEESQYRKLFDLAPVGYLSMDENGIIEKINLAGTCFLHLPSIYLVNTTFSTYLCDEDRELLRDHLKSVANSHLSLTWQVKLKLHDGTECSVMLATSAIRSKKSLEMRYQVMIIDITQQLKTETLLRNANEYLDELAHHDPLTRLPNRVMFTDRLQSMILERTSEKAKIGIIYLDLDGFKPINDTLGHQTGDKVLCTIAGRLGKHLHSADTVARIGGDEFTVILDNPKSADDAIAQAKRIGDIIRQPIHTSEGTVSVSCSMGISLYPEHAQRTDELVKGADAAMYQAKNAGRDQVRLFCKESIESTCRLSQLETSLPFVIRDNQLELHFQPIYNTATLTIVSLEALLRWKHPILGLISPAEFIPLAEKSDCIIDIGKWVLHTACKQANAWRREGFEFPIAVNVSTRQLLESNFADQVSQTLKQFQLDARSLEIEITESAIMIDHHKNREPLLNLRNAGHIITIDDFGAGHSSLARLVHLPVSRLKIDRMFTCDIDRSEKMRSIIKSIISMAHGLGLRVVSEGIELASQLEFLDQANCDAVQGFMMSRAKLPEDITKLLRLDREKVNGLCLDLPELGLEKMSSLHPET
ncbi:MAG: putative bifunctional diguanylate cyclase/phosphodiesterase [Granulosicoccus sp.]